LQRLGGVSFLALGRDRERAQCIDLDGLRESLKGFAGRFDPRNRARDTVHGQV